jgi:alkylated DNA repair dioxygenase AlkB
MELFPEQERYPEGFMYRPEFISQDEEASLLKIIRTVALHPFNYRGFEAKRLVASFGFDYSFDNGKLTRGKDIPVDFVPLVRKVAAFIGFPTEDFVELLITEYPPSAVINWHRDAPPFDVIAGISLLSSCTFRLRPHEKSRQGRGSIISVNVAPRSLYILKGVSRTQWQHSTAPVRDTRYSITLRTLHKGHRQS